MLSEVIPKALKRFKLAEEAESENRKDGLADDKFLAGDQWPQNVKESREIEQRPCLTVNKLDQSVRQVTNDARMNRPSIKIAPTDETTEDKAEVIEGLIRSIQVSSNAEVAYDTAMYSTVSKGWGYIRIITDYCDEKSFDQDILIKRVKNAFTVYFDPYAMEPDYSDAKWCFVVSDEDRDGFKDKYPNSSDITFSSIGDAPAGWLSDKSIRVAEYFEVIETPVKIHLLQDGTTATEEDVKGYEEATGNKLTIKDTRDSVERKVVWRKITAFDILEGGEEGQVWPGKYIPIVPVIGNDVDLDGKRVLKGMVRNATDPQRMYNYWITAETEAIALAPKAPYVGAEGQFEDYEDDWQRANIKTPAYLVYKPTTVGGQLVPPPQRNVAEPPIQAMAAAMAQCTEDIKSTTGIYNAGLGKREGDASGVALKALQNVGNVSTFNYVDNLSMSIRQVGKIIVDLIPHIYDSERIVKIVKPNNEAELIYINKEFNHNGEVKKFDLTEGKYDIVVETGPSYMTKRQESAAAMIQMVQSDPTLMQKAGDMIVKNMDFPEADALSDRLKKFLPPEAQDNNLQDIPPQVQQQLTQSQQMIKQLTETVHSLKDAQDNKDAELASKERIAALQADTQITIEAMKSEMAATNALLMQELKHIGDMFAREHTAALTPPDVPQGTTVDTNGVGNNIQT